MHPEISHAVERVAKWLAAAGYAVDEVEPPPITEPARAWFAVSVAEMKVTLFPVAQQHGSRTIQELFSWYERMGNVVDAAGYMLGVAERTRMTRQWSVFLEEYPLVLTPFLMRSMFSWNYDAQGFAQTKDIFDAAIYSYGVNYLGLPAGVVPIGLVDDLPAGVQIVGRRFREDLILDAMQVVESEVGVLAKQLWARES
jgi:amidase